MVVVLIPFCNGGLGIHKYWTRIFRTNPVPADGWHQSNKIQGSIKGTVMNGASLVAGQIGNAIFIDGNNQYIDYGIHQNECFYDQDECAEGVTFALWFKVHSDAVISTAIDTGATHTQSGEVYMAYIRNHDLKLSIKWDQMYDFYKVPNFLLLTWIHVTFTWDRRIGIRAFLNGCDADPTNSKGYASRTPREKARVKTYSFTVGTGKNGTFEFGQMALDEMMAWNDVLEPSQIWQLFIQGGTTSTVL